MAVQQSPYGPYFDLLAGDYAPTLAYAVDAAESRWGVVSNGARRAARGVAPSDSAGGEVKVDIRVERSLADLGFRTHYSGRGG